MAGGVVTPIRRPGLPAIRLFGGTSDSTTEPLEMTLPVPIRTPPVTRTPAPIHTLSSIVIGLIASAAGGSPRRRAAGSTGWPGESRKLQLPAIRQSLPIVIASATTNEQR